MTICWPSVSLILSATLRAIVLALPPGANGTTSVIGRAGKGSATAGPNTAGRSAANNAAGRTQAPRMEGLPNLLASNQLASSLVCRRTRHGRGASSHSPPSLQPPRRWARGQTAGFTDGGAHGGP